MSRDDERADLTVLDHPLVRHKLTSLRDRRTPPRVFRELVEEISTLMVYEVLRDLPLEPVEVETPVATTAGERFPEGSLVLVPILRAGLGMVRGAELLLPEAPVGHVGLSRDDGGARPEPRRYYFKIPPEPRGRRFLVLDPMVATGSTASAALSELRERGARWIRFVCLIATPGGVRRIRRDHPEVPLYAASLDEGLDDEGFVVPGLGDAGDRLFGTR